MKKIISLILMMVIIINIIPVISRAKTISEADLYSKEYSGGLLKWGDINLECDVVVYKNNGVEYPAYCLQRDLKGVDSETGYSVSVNKLVTDVMVWRTIINGYPYKSISELGCKTETEAFMATKQAVYCALYNRDVNTYSARNEAGERCLNAMKQIVAAAKKSTATKISSSIGIEQENSKWKIDKIQNEYVMQIFKIKAEGTINKYEISIEGDIPEGTKITDLNNKEKSTFKSEESFKIMIPLKNIEKDGNFVVNAKGEVNTKPILYGKSANSNNQDYALTAYSYEDGEGSKKVYYSKNETKITIVKMEEETENKLQGVEFELLDEKENVLFTGLKTDENGQVEINNLTPGKYYIKETKTLEGYQIYDKLIEVNLELNEQATINVINNEEKIEREVQPKETEKEVQKKETEITVKNKNQEKSIKLPKTGM